ncbi:hypothetical protein Tco_1392315 [Tanacetum coccineum]
MNIFTRDFDTKRYRVFDVIKYPETFLCVDGLIRVCDDEESQPTFLDSDDEEMGLFNFITSSDPFKVKVGDRRLADGDVTLLEETKDTVIPPSDEVIVDHNIVDELRDVAVGKGGSKKRDTFDDVEPAAKKVKAKNVSVPKWDITNDFKMDDAWVCHNFNDHLSSPSYWATLQNMPSLDFLNLFSVNAARQACMNFELRLRFKYEIE